MRTNQVPSQSPFGIALQGFSDHFHLERYLLENSANHTKIFQYSYFEPSKKREG